MPDTPDLHADDARQRLLQATERLVYAGGIHATGMDLIVKTSGVARKRVYQYYPNKDALVAAALRARDERWMGWFIDATSRAATPRRPRPTLRRPAAPRPRSAQRSRTSTLARTPCRSCAAAACRTSRVSTSSCAC